MIGSRIFHKGICIEEPRVSFNYNWGGPWLRRLGWFLQRLIKELMYRKLKNASFVSCSSNTFFNRDSCMKRFYSQPDLRKSRRSLILKVHGAPANPLPRPSSVDRGIYVTPPHRSTFSLFCCRSRFRTNASQAKIQFKEFRLHQRCVSRQQFHHCCI